MGSVEKQKINNKKREEDNNNKKGWACVVEGARPTRQRTDDGTKYTVPALAHAHAPVKCGGSFCRSRRATKGPISSAERGRKESKDEEQG